MERPIRTLQATTHTGQPQHSSRYSKSKSMGRMWIYFLEISKPQGPSTHERWIRIGQMDIDSTIRKTRNSDKDYFSLQTKPLQLRSPRIDILST